MKSTFSMVTSMAVMAAVVSSAAMAADKANFNGLYGGLGAGYITGDNHLKSSYILTNNSTSKDVSGRGFNGELFLGYGCLFGRSTPLYLGAEVLGGLSNFEGKTENIQKLTAVTSELTRTKSRMRNSYGAGLRVGTIFSNMLTYLKVGALNSKWEMKSEDFVTGAAAERKTLSKRLTGLTLGLGIEAPLTHKIAVGAEFVHTQYRAAKLTHPTVATYTLKPRTNEAKLRLTYHIM